MVSILKRKQEAAAELDRAEVKDTLDGISQSLQSFHAYVSIDQITKERVDELENGISRLTGEMAKNSYTNEMLRGDLLSVRKELAEIMGECMEKKGIAYRYVMGVHNEAQNPYTQPVSELRESVDAIGRLLAAKKR